MAARLGTSIETPDLIEEEHDMRWFCGLLMAAGLVLADVPAATAQDSLGSFGGYPAGITSGSTYGFYPGGYRQTYSGSAMSPGVTYYSSGFYGGTPGTTTYGPGVNFSSPSAAAYGYSRPVYPGTAYAPSYGYSYAPRYGYGTYSARPGWSRGGLFGGRSYRW